MKNQSVTQINVESIEKQIAVLEKKIQVYENIVQSLKTLNQDFLKFFNTEINDIQHSRMTPREKLDAKRPIASKMKEDIENNISTKMLFEQYIENFKNEINSLKQQILINKGGTRKHKNKKHKNRTLRH